MAIDADFIISLVIECFLYTFHLSILLLLIVKRKNIFNGAFFDIFRIILIADFLGFVAFIIAQRICYIEYFVDFYKSSTIFCTFMSLSINFLVAIQYFARLLLAFNRFTLIWFPVYYAKVWNKQWYTVLTLLIAFLHIAWRLHEPFRYTYSPTGGTLSISDNPAIQPMVKILSAIILFSTTVAAAVFNGLLFAKFYYNKKKIFNYQLNEQYLLSVLLKNYNYKLIFPEENMAIDADFVISLVVESFLYTFHFSILLLLIVKRHNIFKGPFFDILRTVLVVDFLSFVVNAFYTFHLSILLLLIVKRKIVFKGSFFNIFRIVLVADFLSYVVSTIDQRISLIPYLTDTYKESTILPCLTSFSTPFLVTIQFFGRMLMAFNRFTAIWFPLKQNRLWEKQWYTVLILLLPFLIICWRFHEPVRYMYLANGNIFAVFANPSLQPIIKALAATIYLSTTIAAAVFNGLSFAKFCYNKRKLVNYRLNEQHLLFMSIIILFAQLARASYPVQQYLFPTNQNLIAFFSSILSILNDALALSGSISFFLLSKTAREEYAKFYFNKNSNVILSTTNTFATSFHK